MAVQRVLVVDDSKLARLTISKYLKKQGYEVSAAENGKEALTAVEAHRPDAVVMDYMMPEMDGHEATRQLVANPATASIPIIICSGVEDDEGERVRAKENGASGYIKKPVTEAKLLEAFARLPESTTTAESLATRDPLEERLEAYVRETAEAATRAWVEKHFREQVTQAARQMAPQLARQAAEAVYAKIDQEIEAKVRARLQDGE
jgi:CheY-like chemotaxis protein